MITSTRNARIVAALRLHTRAHRDADRRFLVEGAQAVGEALAAGPGTLVTLFAREADHPLARQATGQGVEVVAVGEAVMERLAGTVTPQGLVGIAAYRDVALDALPRTPTCVVVLHEVRDPGNAGTILRSADAAGADAVVFAGSTVDPYNAKVVRASAGSIFHLPVVRSAATADALAALRDRGCAVLAMAGDGEDDLYDAPLDRPLAFLFGNEAQGLDAATRGLADAVVRIPIPGRAESLNLAAAATVCLFEWARRRPSAPR
ncbi:MAG: TrmH family RNA methyltransferase [Actinomycetota bacterium]